MPHPAHASAPPPMARGDALARDPERRALARFLAVGAVGLGTDAAAFWLATQAGGSLPLARAASLGLATVVTWRLNRRFTFGPSRGRPAAEAMRYALVALGAQGGNLFVFVALCRSLPEVTPLALLAVSAACATFLSFTGQRLLTFGESARTKS